MASGSTACDCRALIRHPLLWQAAPAAPAAAAPALSLTTAPLEVLHAVAALLDSARDLAAFGSVCRATRAVAEDQQLWRALTLQRFPVPLRSSPPQPGGWKGLYKFNHQVVRGVLLHKDLQKQLDAAYPRLWHAGVHA